MAKDLVVGICQFTPGLSCLMPEAVAGCHGLTKGKTGKSSRITVAFHLAPSLFVQHKKASGTISRRVGAGVSRQALPSPCTYQAIDTLPTLR